MAGRLWLATKVVAQPVPTAQLLYSTNGVPKSVMTGLGSVAVLMGSSAAEAQRLQRWLDSGTNVAVFRISNSLPRYIDLLQFTRFEEDDGLRHFEDAPILTTGLPGMGPGESTTIRVALLPHTRRWRLQIDYMPRPVSGGFFDVLIRSIKRARRIGQSERARTIVTEWVEP